MKIQVDFNEKELKVIRRALTVAIIHSDNEKEIDGFGAFLRAVDLYKVVELPMTFSQNGLKVIDSALKVGVVHSESDEEELLMTKLERNINLIASIPQTI